MRTKNDWADREAERVFAVARRPFPGNAQTPVAHASVREIAATLRRAERRGRRNERRDLRAFAAAGGSDA